MKKQTLAGLLALALCLALLLPACGEKEPDPAQQALDTAAYMLQAQTAEGMVIVAKGEGDVYGQHAYLFDLMPGDSLSRDTEYYAVTDDGVFWMLDVLTGEWGPGSVG